MRAAPSNRIGKLAWDIEQVDRRVQQLRADLRDLGIVGAEERPVVARIILEGVADLQRRVNDLRRYRPALEALARES
ncbi:MAG: hypothetical protein AB1609_20965 [Bacillota bacterium]